jgi:acetoin utilization deacetylase AcuC-like enzyme
VRVFYSPAYVAAGYSFETTRKAAWVAASLAAEPIAGVELVEPRPMTREQVAAVHDPDYVRAIETGEPRELAESQGFEWDAALLPAVLASNGGAVAAALAALEEGVAGSLSSGLHHAKRSSGAGFCTFNGLVLAARTALAAGARGVLILDFDAHCGGGTASLIGNDVRITQFDVSTSHFDQYRSTPRARLALVDSAAQYMDCVQRALNDADTLGAVYDVCLYNAGMDPYEGCPVGGLPCIDRAMLAERERHVFGWCARRGLPVAFVLAGGYLGPRLDRASLVNLHRLTLAAAASISKRGD